MERHASGSGFIGHGFRYRKPAVFQAADIDRAVPDVPGPESAVCVRSQVFKNAFHGYGMRGNQDIPGEMPDIFHKGTGTADHALQGFHAMRRRCVRKIAEKGGKLRRRMGEIGALIGPVVHFQKPAVFLCRKIRRDDAGGLHGPAQRACERVVKRDMKAPEQRCGFPCLVFTGGIQGMVAAALENALAVQRSLAVTDDIDGRDVNGWLQENGARG